MKVWRELENAPAIGRSRANESGFAPISCLGYHAHAPRRKRSQEDRYDPDLWADEFSFLNQSGQADIQSDLFYDYRTNIDSYPKWQAWMRERQPQLL